jgi:hypothetical protein
MGGLVSGIRVSIPLQVEEAEKAFCRVRELDGSKTRTMIAYRFRGHMLQCMGQHAAAAEILSKALAPLNGRLLQEQRIECMYLRGACKFHLLVSMLMFSTIFQVAPWPSETQPLPLQCQLKSTCACC